jgi:cysteate synthase
MRAYRLRCSGCGASFEDDGALLDCTQSHTPALLQTAFAEQRFRTTDEPSMLRFRSWLPMGRDMTTAANVGVFPSRGLAKRLGLSDLWIAFNGWWPERGSTLRTATFKELEALAVLGRLAPDEQRTMVVASAGNTAAAFADTCTVNEMPLVIVVPASAFARIASIARIGPSVSIVALAGAEYDDAIAFARRLATLDDFIFEGGVRNVARRDGLGLVMLVAAEAMGALPAYYFQAVGSAAGALGVREAARRLIGDGRFGSAVPQLMLAQNHPFTPLYDAWRTRAEVLPERSPAEAKAQIAQIAATVLSNQMPPYTIAGGVREALVESNGEMFSVTNGEMAAAMALFEEIEGIDIDPEGGIAVAALMRAVAAGAVEADARILLNVTGGGRSLRPRETAHVEPALVLDRAAFAGDAHDAVRSLLFSTR